MNDQLFESTEESGVYYLLPAHQGSAVDAAKKKGLLVLTVEIAARANKDQALKQLGAALHFPTWYGANFDALFDCLTDPDWQPGRGHVIMIKGMVDLRATNPDDFATLIEVFQAATEARREAASPFWVLIDTPARGIPALPVT